MSHITFPSSLALSICASACATLNTGLAERGKVVNSWWVEAMFVGERGFLEL